MKNKDQLSEDPSDGGNLLHGFKTQQFVVSPLPDIFNPSVCLKVMSANPSKLFSSAVLATEVAGASA